MEVKQGYKKTEIGIIPEDWEVVHIGNLFEFKNGLNKEKQYFGKGTPIVNYMDVYKNNGLYANGIQGKVTLSRQEIKNYEVKKGDVFFTRTSETVDEIGVSSVMLEDVKDTVFSGFILRARPKNNSLFDNYKKYCFSTQQVRKEITNKSTYTTRALTNGRLLSQVKIPLPSYKEQTAIATALSDTDALIESLENLIAKKRLIKQGAMQELLKPKEGWEMKKLGDSLVIKKGQLITESKTINGNIPVIAGGKTPAYFHNKANRFGKTITVSCSGASAGYVAFHNYPIFASDCSTIEEHKDYSIQYIFYLLLSIQDKIYKMQTGGAQPHIHPSDLRPIELPFPKKEKQEQIATILSDMDKEVEALEFKLEKYRKIKVGMMQQLLTGKIRLV
ncbi:MAG: restriction endonuclease subunit S [Bacteroidales bacterium]